MYITSPSSYKNTTLFKISFFLNRLSSYSYFQLLFIISITQEEFVLLHELKIQREDKFKYGFRDTLNLLCNCGNELDSTEHFLLHCPQFVNEKCTLLDTLIHLNYSLLENASNVLKQTLLFGNMSLSPSDKSKILNAIFYFVLSTIRLNEQLF